MRLRKVFDGERLTRGASGAVVDVGPNAVQGVEILNVREGPHRFSPNFVNGGVAEGWLSLAKGRIIVHAVDGTEVVFRIVRAPGLYCCHCDAKLGGPTEGTGNVEVAKRCLAHVKACGKGQPSPDPQNPSGYRGENFYTAVNAGGTVNNMTPDEAAALERKVRAELNERKMRLVGSAKASSSEAK